MIKNSLLLTLLFASDSVSSLQIESRSANGVCESIDIFEQKESSKMAGEVEQSCKAGIERLRKGDSNSWAAFRNSLDVNTTWNDPGFPADETSLMWEKKFGRETAEYQPPVKQIQWLRPSEMGGHNRQFPSKPTLFGEIGRPVPNGITQNELGDCWFLAAVSSLAEVPDRITKIIWNDDYNDFGAFRFYFWVKNAWYGVNVDDRLPCMNEETTDENGARVYRPWSTWPSVAGAWWMPLLEKAYAKLDLNYDNISGGEGQEALRTLTGMPTTDIPLGLNRKEKLLPIHKYLASRNFPMTSGCCHKGGIHSLVTGHAYSLLDVAELKDEAGVIQHTIVKMRNPWANEQYTGPWRDDDPRWTRIWREQVGLKQDNDGVFWMDYDTYLTYFMNTGVAFYDKYAAYELREVNMRKPKAIYYLNNPVSQHLYITGETYSRRHYPRAEFCDPKTDTVLTLFNEKWEKVGEIGYIEYNGFATVGSLHEPLPAGAYKVFLRNQSENKHVDIALNFYFLKEKGEITGGDQW